MNESNLNASERALLERINAAQPMTITDGIKLGIGMGIVMFGVAGLFMMLMVFRAVI